MNYINTNGQYVHYINSEQFGFNAVCKIGSCFNGRVCGKESVVGTRRGVAVKQKGS